MYYKYSWLFCPIFAFFLWFLRQDCLQLSVLSGLVPIKRCHSIWQLSELTPSTQVNWAKKKITAKHQRKLEEKVLTPISGCHNLPSTTPFSSSSTTTTSISSTLTASPSPMATPDLAVTLWRAYPDTAVFDWLITLQVRPTASTKGYKHQKWK